MYLGIPEKIIKSKFKYIKYHPIQLAWIVGDEFGTAGIIFYEHCQIKLKNNKMRFNKKKTMDVCNLLSKKMELHNFIKK